MAARDVSISRIYASAFSDSPSRMAAAGYVWRAGKSVCLWRGRNGDQPWRAALTLAAARNVMNATFF